MPDVVLNLNLTQGWGSAQLSGAIHQIKSANGNTAINADTQYGFAGLAGLKINLPMLAQGDLLWLQGVYAEGAAGYLGAGTYGSFPNINPVQIGGILLNAFDAVAVPDAAGTATLKKTKGYALTAALLHYWTPTIRQTVYDSYLNIDSATNPERKRHRLQGIPGRLEPDLVPRRRSRYRRRGSLHEARSQGARSGPQPRRQLHACVE